MLSPAQLSSLGLRRGPGHEVFHDFTPSPLMPATRIARNEILLMGYPSHLKGADLLIRTFCLIADRHPDVTLHLVGHCPDRAPVERLANGHSRIRRSKAVQSIRGLELISGCRVFSLPSRTEAMGRVMLEAMAAGKLIVASNVDGIPHQVRHGEHGLLFETKNTADLAAWLDRLLSNDGLASRLGENGRRPAQTGYTELH